MKVLVIDNQGNTVWEHDVSSPTDESGNAWRNDGHLIMSGVLFSLRKAVSQAEEFPKEKNWRWPFSILPDSKFTIQKVGQRVAHEVPREAASSPVRSCPHCCSMCACR